MHVSYYPFKGINLTVLPPVYYSGGGVGVGTGVGRVGQLNMCVENIHCFEGINVTVLEIMHQFIRGKSYNMMDPEQ